MRFAQVKLAIIILSASVFWGCGKSNTPPNVITPPPPPPYTGKILTNLTYGINKDWLGQTQNLLMSIYFPSSEIPTTKTPLIVFCHGGGYVSGDKESSKGECEQLASAGYIVATIDYRLGYPQYGNVICNTLNSSGTHEAYYRGQQDARAALRYLVFNATKYAIDTNWIFIEGQSAGAGMALGVAYFTQDSLDYYLPNISDTLGLLDNAGNNLKTTYTIKGIGSMWGGLLFTDDVITKSTAKPTIFFHGELDTVDPWDVGNLYECSAFSIHYGSKPLYDKTVSYGVPAVAHIDPTGGHGIYTSKFNEDNIACFFTSLMQKQPETGYYTTQVANCK